MRCFIGVPVDGELARRLRGLPLPAGARAVRGGDLHLTLAFLGERDESWARSLWVPVAQALAGVPGLAAPVIGIGPFPRSGGRIWAAAVSPVPALLALHGAVWGVLESAGVEREKRRWRPHLTLARAAAPITDPGWSLSETLSVTRAVFYQSPGGDAGYRRLAAWPLG